MYEVCHFPSISGTPIRVKYWLVARLIGWYRGIKYFPCEVRIVDLKTNEHYVY